MNTEQFNRYNRFLLRHRLLIFLILLIMQLTIFPFVYEYYDGLLGVLEIFFSIVLMMAIYILSSNRQLLTISFFLATLTLTIVWFNVLLENTKLMIFGLSLEITFFSLTTYVLLSHVLSFKRVTADKIYGTMSGYLLIGLIFAMIYSMIDQMFPGSFTPDPGGLRMFNKDIGYPFNFARFIYYSFSTLTTTGYGDITALSPPARMASAFEAIMGQLYIAVLISRIVGLHIGHSIFRNR